MDFGLVPVRLDFDLGERLITLDRLRTLAPGEVFELDPVVDGCAAHPRQWHGRGSGRAGRGGRQHRRAAEGPEAGDS